MIINRRKGETEEAYFARLAEVHKSLGYGDTPAGWPSPKPTDGEEEEEPSDGDA